MLLYLSLVLPDLLALFRYGRTFRLLPPARREALVLGLAEHRLGRVRSLVRWWKAVALVTRC